MLLLFWLRHWLQLSLVLLFMLTMVLMPWEWELIAQYFEILTFQKTIKPRSNAYNNTSSGGLEHILKGLLRLCNYLLSFGNRPALSF